jgi:hypothetical protein
MPTIIPTTSCSHGTFPLCINNLDKKPDISRLSLDLKEEVKIHEKRARLILFRKLTSMNVVLTHVVVRLGTFSFVLQDLRVLPFHVLMSLTNFLSTFTDDVLFLDGMQVPLSEIQVDCDDTAELVSAASTLLEADLPLSQFPFLHQLVDNALNHWHSDKNFTKLVEYVSSGRGEL